MKMNIILGPPGCGKTTTLLEILEELLLKYDPNEIAYVSFTRTGAYEGRDRAKKKFGLKNADFPYFKTLHSICFSEGKYSMDDMIKTKHFEILSKSLNMHFTGHINKEFYNDDDKYLFFQSLRRNNPLTADRYSRELDLMVLKFVNVYYKELKKYFKVFDYTDIVERFVDNNQPLPVKVAIIDEAQDLTALQWKMALIAFRDCDEIYIAGDDDQAIYEWAGADVNFFLHLKGEVTILNKSHRLPRSILNYAKMISSSIHNRVEKKFTDRGATGNICPLASIDELKLHDTKESWLLLARNNNRLKLYEKYLQDRGIVYRIKGQLSVNRNDVKAINIFEEFRKDHLMTPETEYFMKGYFKDEINTDYPWYDNLNFSEDKMIYYRNIIGNKVDTSECNIDINTIHSIKGAEADNVVLFTDISKPAYENYIYNNDSELRVYYVACTRAKKNLFLIYPDSNFYYPIYGSDYDIS